MLYDEVIISVLAEVNGLFLMSKIISCVNNNFLCHTEGSKCGPNSLYSCKK